MNINKLRKLQGASIDSLLLTFMQIVTYATGMITTKIISVSLSLDDYGTYSSVLLVISVAASFTLLGLGDCLNYYYNNKQTCKADEVRNKYVNSIYLAQSVIGVIVGMILLLFRNRIAGYFGNAAVGCLMIIVCFKPWFENMIHLYQVLFVSVGQAKVIAIRNFVLALARVAIVFVALTIFNSLDLVFILLVVVDIIQIVTFNTYFSKRNFRVTVFAGDYRLFKSIFAYSLPMGVYFIMNTLMREIDKLVIASSATQSDLAIYTNCSKQLPLNLFVSSFATVLVPYIMQFVSQKRNREAVSLFSNYMKLGYLSIWMFSGAILIVTKEIIPFLYSDAYLSGEWIFIVYIITGMVQFASMHLIVAANGDTKYLMSISIATLMLNVILNIMLFKLFALFGQAMVGPAVSTLIITIIYTVLILGKSKKILNSNLRDLLDIKDLVFYAIQLLMVGTLCYYCKNLLISAGLNRYFSMIIICGMYCCIIFALHFKEYIQILKIINSYKLAK